MIEESFALCKEALEKDGVFAIVPEGNSMWPTLKHRGQSVFIVKKTERLKKYDVALYYRKDKHLVLHRVVEVKDEGYIMCGDSMFYLEPVKEENVLGVMEGFYKGKKYIKTSDKKYIKKSISWYNHPKRRKFILALFRINLKIKGFLVKVYRKVFKRKEIDV